MLTLNSPLQYYNVLWVIHFYFLTWLSQKIHISLLLLMGNLQLWTESQHWVNKGTNFPIYSWFLPWKYSKNTLSWGSQKTKYNVAKIWYIVLFLKENTSGSICSWHDRCYVCVDYVIQSQWCPTHGVCPTQGASTLAVDTVHAGWVFVILRSHSVIEGSNLSHGRGHTGDQTSYSVEEGGRSVLIVNVFRSTGADSP